MAKFLSESGLSTLVQNIKQSFDNIEERIDDNEYVVAQSLIDINDRLSDKQDTIDSSHKLSADLISDGSTNKAYTATEKTKLSGIATGAEVNVQANWNESNSSSDAYIQNKPNITQDQYGTDINGANNYVRLSDGYNIIDLDYAGNSGINITSNNGNDGVIDINASSDIYIEGDTVLIDTNSGNSSINVSDSGILFDGNVYQTQIINHGTSDTIFTLTPNKYHIWGEVSSLTLTLGSGVSGYLSEYMFEFQSGSTPTTLTLPNTVEWPSTPTIEANKRYQVSIVSNIALMVGV